MKTPTLRQAISIQYLSGGDMPWWMDDKTKEILSDWCIANYGIDKATGKDLAAIAKMIDFGEEKMSFKEFEESQPCVDAYCYERKTKQHRDWCTWKMNPSIGNEDTFCNCDAGHKD